MLRGLQRRRAREICSVHSVELRICPVFPDSIHIDLTVTFTSPRIVFLGALEDTREDLLAHLTDGSPAPAVKLCTPYLLAPQRAVSG